MTNSNAVDQLSEIYTAIDLAGRISLPQSSQELFGNEIFGKKKKPKAMKIDEGVDPSKMTIAESNNTITS